MERWYTRGAAAALSVEERECGTGCQRARMWRWMWRSTSVALVAMKRSPGAYLNVSMLLIFVDDNRMARVMIDVEFDHCWSLFCWALLFAVFCKRKDVVILVVSLSPSILSSMIWVCRFSLLNKKNKDLALSESYHECLFAPCECNVDDDQNVQLSGLIGTRSGFLLIASKCILFICNDRQKSNNFGIILIHLNWLLVLDIKNISMCLEHIYA